MKQYSSNEEFFQDVLDFADRLTQSGQGAAAIELRDGFSCLNGLTDGWGMFMESVEQILTTHGKQLSVEQTANLQEILHVARNAVFR